MEILRCKEVICNLTRKQGLKRLSRKESNVLRKISAVNEY